MMRCYILLLSFLCFFSGCDDPSKKENKENKERAEKLVSEWHGRSISFVRDLPCRIMGNDTIAEDFFDKPCKILVYVDSAGCTSCRLQLSEWKRLLEEMSPVQDKVGVLFVFQTPNREKLDELFVRFGVRYPYFQDKDEKFKKVNQFPEDMSAQVFLLDKDNRVVLVGRPIGNTKMWQLYRDQITAMLDLKEGEWPGKKEEIKQ